MHELKSVFSHVNSAVNTTLPTLGCAILCRDNAGMLRQQMCGCYNKREMISQPGARSITLVVQGA